MAEEFVESSKDRFPIREEDTGPEAGVGHGDARAIAIRAGGQPESVGGNRGGERRGDGVRKMTR